MSISTRAEMQYRASFFMLFFSYALSTLVGILGIWVLFDRFKQVEGWDFAEVSILYGVVHMGFGIAETFARGLDKFDLMLINADFDRVLLRPVGSLFQVACSKVQPMRLGRFVQGLLVLLIGLHSLGIPFFSFPVAVIAASVAGAACLFYGLLILQATLAFWTTESLEIMNIASFGGVEACQYPLVIYPKAFQFIFTFLIPVACVSYFPVAAILGRFEGGYSPSAFLMFLPVVGLLFLLLSSRVWRFGVKKYASSGS